MLHVLLESSRDTTAMQCACCLHSVGLIENATSAVWELLTCVIEHRLLGNPCNR